MRRLATIFRLQLVFAACMAALFALSGCGLHKALMPDEIASSGAPAQSTRGKVPAKRYKKSRPYTVMGKTYYPTDSASGYNEIGIASWYGRDFHGRPTATGETYDMYKLTAAHKTLPLGAVVKVTNLKNGKSVVVDVNDRGPFVDGRIIDLSYSAAKAIDMDRDGISRVRVSTIRDVPTAPASRTMTASRTVRTQAPTGRTAKAQTSSAARKYYVQVGAFSVSENARRLRSSLIRQGFKGSRITRTSTASGELYSVHAGAFAGQRDAHKALMLLKQRFPDSFLLSSN